MYQYLIGTGILGIVWIGFLLLRKDLWRVMVWSSFGYFILFIFGLIILPILNHFISPEIAFNPGYWHPSSLWNLNYRTGGVGLEDGFFMFFIGGISAASYEIIFHKKVGKPKKHGYRLHALEVGMIVAILFALLIRINLIWPMIIFGFVSAFAEIKERHDLYAHAVWGGIVFFLVYLIMFELFLTIYPSFIVSTYNLHNLSGLILFGLPIEELLYAFSFGIMWAPIYEYTTGAKDKNL